MRFVLHRDSVSDIAARISVWFCRRGFYQVYLGAFSNRNGSLMEKAGICQTRVHLVFDTRIVVCLLFTASLLKVLQGTF